MNHNSLPQDIQSKGQAKIVVVFAIFLAYLALALITTWPLASHLTTHLPGGSNDTFVHYWNGWWVQKALAMGHSPFYTSFIFYPNEVTLVTHNIAWFNVIPWLLLEPLMGGIVAYNLSILLNLAFCGSAAFLLTYKLTTDKRAAFVAGLIYLAWPYRLSQLYHPNLISTQWIPIFFLALIVTIRQAQQQKSLYVSSLLTGLSFALVGYTRWQLLIPVTIMALIYFVCTMPAWWQRRRVVISGLLLAASIAVILLLPAIFLLSQEQGEEASAELLHQQGSEEARMQTDLLGYLTPSPAHTFLKEQTEPLYNRYYRDIPTRYDANYIGVFALLLALGGIYVKRRQSLPWLLMALVLILLALGPILRFNGELYEDVPMFYRILSPTYIIRLMRVPNRYNMFLALPISVLAAYGAASLFRLSVWRRQWSAYVLSGGLASLILFEYLAIPMPLYDVSVPLPFEQQLAYQSGEPDFAVLNLPIEAERAKIYMFNQTIHQRPILQGHISRPPLNATAYIDHNPFLHRLDDVQPLPSELNDVGRQFATLREDGFRYIIIHKWFFNSETDKKVLEHWQDYFLSKPYYEDEERLVYRTSPQISRDVDLSQELTLGLGIIKTLVSTDCVSPNRALEVDVAWGSTQPLEQEFDVLLKLVDGAGIEGMSQRFPLSDVWPTSQWAANSLAWGYYTLFVSPELPPGEYTLTLSLLDQQGQALPSAQTIAIQPIRVQAEICNLASKEEAKDLNAIFGEQLRLVEIEVEQEEKELDLALYWRTERRMETDYTIFIHLFDPATGFPVAQRDSWPKGGRYRTTIWSLGERVDDQISISTSDVPPGTYQIGIGVYDLATGERLPVVNHQGQSIEDRRLVLDELIELP